MVIIGVAAGNDDFSKDFGIGLRNQARQRGSCVSIGISNKRRRQRHHS